MFFRKRWVNIGSGRVGSDLRGCGTGAGRLAATDDSSPTRDDPATEGAAGKNARVRSASSDNAIPTRCLSTTDQHARGRSARSRSPVYVVQAHTGTKEGQKTQIYIKRSW